jgi:hypothetical protein
MANESRYTTPTAQTSVADNTALASRANGYYAPAQVSSADVVIDNSTTLHLFMDLELELGAAAWAVGGFFEIYLVEALDGTTYDTGSTTVLPAADNLVAAIGTHGNASALSSQAIQISRNLIVIPPAKFKLLWRNQSGVTTAATGNAMRYRLHSLNLNG